MIAFLFQATDPQPQPFWHLLLDNALALTVLVIFLAAAIGAITRLRRKDKCLKLLDDHHVTYLDRGGRAMWGDLVVYSQGLELRFDAPHTNRRGLVKTSALLYQDALEKCLALVRLDLALTDAERAQRVRQIRKSFRPGPIRRASRYGRNLVNTMRDAIGQAINTLLDAFAKKRGATTLSKNQNPALAETLVSTVSHAYSPMLEQHIGKPVVLRIEIPDREGLPAFEVPGYLVDYTDAWVAVFNVEHTQAREEEVQVSESLARPDLRVELSDDHVKVTNPGSEVCVVRSAKIAGRRHDLGVALFPGSSIELARTTGGADADVTLACLWTQRYDIVCPRKLARVEFGADSTGKDRHPHDGLAPVQEEEEA